jgi:cytochrome oxidase Cu insertion factor (SCO1/SenC/PrrC family)
MNSGLNDASSVLVAAFKAALLHQGLVALLILAVLAVAWVSVREWIPSVRTATRAGGSARARTGTAEPAGRRLLRIGFGIIWVFDGLLQAQPRMAAGLPSAAIEPAAASSPHWVQHLVNWAGTSWSYHPIQAGAAAVWIQVGIGGWLIASSSPRLSRLAGLVSVGWGLVVWVFGEAFGGIFAPGLTFLFGAPGAVAFYCAAGVLVALPERCWRTPLLGRRILGGLGLFLVGMAVLQAWPGRGFWAGTRHGRPGPLTSMIQSMSATPQPRFLAAGVSGFGSFAGAHGLAVNLLTVIALAAIGAGLLSGRPRLIRVAIIVMIAFCLADWVLIEDLGFLGGLGTDPNSMIPVALLGAGGYLALSRAPAAAREPAVIAEPGITAEPAVTAEPAIAEPAIAEPAIAEPAMTPQPAVAAEPGGPAARRAGWPDRGRPARLALAFGTASLSTVLALWAAVVVLIGAAPMAMAQASPNADPIIAQAIDGDSAPLNFTAPAFTLTDQDGSQVSLASLRGKVVLLTFLDPVCTSDCPQIAQEFRGADQVLGASARNVELVAIDANPLYRQVAYTRAFDRQERLTSVPNWLFLTGSLAQLRQAWRRYDVAAQVLPAGGMIAHSDVAYVIDASGQIRTELDFDPGPGTATTESSFAVELSDAARQVMRPS